MPDQQHNYDVDDVMDLNLISPLFSFIPDDVAVFRANEIGGWAWGYILASANPDFGLWTIHSSPTINNPEQFDRTHAVWVDDGSLADWFIEQRLLEGPNDSINKPLTAMDVE